jgi:hypothetical protein
VVDFYASGHGNAANDLLGAVESILEREVGEGSEVIGPAGEGVEERRASGSAAAASSTPPVEGAESAPSSLIHEEKARTPEGTKGYEPNLDIAESLRIEPLFERVNRYANHHRRALEMAEFCEPLAPHRSDKLRSCGAFLQFRDYYTLGQVRLTSACFCQQDRLCGLCACRRGGRLLRAYVERTQALLRSHSHLRPWFITLTVKDGPDLGERVDHLLKSVRRLQQLQRDYLSNRRKGKKVASPSMACAAAGVGSCEVKRGSGSGLWHPHWHAVWMCTTPPDVQQLRAEWAEITGDSFVVDARPFHLAALLDASGVDVPWETMAGDFCEVFKYTLKLGDLPLSDNWSAFVTLQRKHLISPFGLYRGIEIPEDLTDSLLSPDLPFVEFLMRYHQGSYASAAEIHQTHDVTKCSLWPRRDPRQMLDWCSPAKKHELSEPAGRVRVRLPGGVFYR